MPSLQASVLNGDSEVIPLAYLLADLFFVVLRRENGKSAYLSSCDCVFLRHERWYGRSGIPSSGMSSLAYQTHIYIRDIYVSLVLTWGGRG
jgi:hypothetical protein